MWMKQVGYKPRSNSMSSSTSDDGAGKGSASSQNASPTAISGGTGKESTPANNVNAGRRRSSAGNYAGLSNLKRNSQDNKYASYLEQKPGSGGLLTGLWHDFTRK